MCVRERGVVELTEVEREREQIICWSLQNTLFMVCLTAIAVCLAIIMLRGN